MLHPCACSGFGQAFAMGARSHKPRGGKGTKVQRTRHAFLRMICTHGGIRVSAAACQAVSKVVSKRNKVEGVL